MGGDELNKSSKQRIKEARERFSLPAGEPTSRPSVAEDDPLAAEKVSVPEPASQEEGPLEPSDSSGAQVRPSTTAREPGWYNDPSGKAVHQAYWDGEKWTGATRPDPGSGSSVSVKKTGRPFRRFWQLLSVAWLIALGVGLVVALLNAAERDDSGAIVTAGDVDVEDLRPGDCFTEPSSDMVSDVSAVPCAEPHDYEVFAVDALSAKPDEGFPGDDEVEVQSALLCLTYFESYFGVPYSISDLEVYMITPSRLSWDDDRGVVCAAYGDGDVLVGSVEGSGR